MVAASQAGRTGDGYGLRLACNGGLFRYCQLQTGNWSLARKRVGFVISRSERAWCFSKYLSLFIRTHVELHRDRRRHLRPRLNLNLNLNLCLYLYLYLYLILNLFLFQKPSQKPFEASFVLSFGFK